MVIDCMAGVLEGEVVDILDYLSYNYPQSHPNAIIDQVVWLVTYQQSEWLYQVFTSNDTLINLYVNKVYIEPIRQIYGQHYSWDSQNIEYDLDYED